MATFAKPKLTGKKVKEGENRQRLVSLIDHVGLKAFQVTLDYLATRQGAYPGNPSPSFHTVLQTRKSFLSDRRLRKSREKKPITEQQWNKLYPEEEKIVTTEDLDMDLCYILLKEGTICGLKSPGPNGWDFYEPAKDDKSLEGSLVQLKKIRQTMNTSFRLTLTNSAFDTYFSKATDAIQNISAKLPPGKFDVDKEVIDKYKTCAIEQLKDLTNERSFMGEAELREVTKTPSGDNDQATEQLHPIRDQGETTALSEKQKNYLRKNRPELTERIDLCNGLMSILLSNDVISYREKERIENAVKNESQHRGVEILLDMLVRRDQTSYERFCKSLIDNRQEHIVNDYLK